MTQMSELGSSAPARSSTVDAASSLLDCVRRARSLHRMNFDGTEPDIVRLPESAATELVSRLAGEVGRDICQIVPFTGERQSVETFGDLVWRNLAASGRKVRRVYLVPSGQEHAGRLQAMLDEDRRAGMEVAALPVGGARLGGAFPMYNTWLIDDVIVIRQEHGGDQSPVWEASAIPADVRRARTLWQDVQKSILDRPSTDALDLTDLILKSAPTIRTMAPLSCNGGHVDQESCAWYHGIWQYLRLFDMVSSPGWHSEFYRRRLRARIARLDRPRVLITGAADYSMLAHVVTASQDRNIDAHVVDMCQTPLMACRWYAQNLKLPVGLHRLDLTDPDCATRLLTDSGPNDAEANTPFDLIVTDAFLTRFTRDAADTVVANWSRLLKDGGAVVTTVRLHGHDQHRQGGVTSEVADFVLRFRKHATAWRAVLDVDIEELLDATHEYALRMTSADLGEVDDLVRLLAAHGLRVGHHESVKVEGELRRTGYVRLVAEKMKSVRGTVH